MHSLNENVMRPINGLRKLVARRNKNIAAVALAAKNARIAWAVLAHERSYQHNYVANRAGRLVSTDKTESKDRKVSERKDFRRLLRQT